jgi:5'-3' exonuclease
MGIKNLNKLIKKYAEDCIKKASLSDYSYKKIAIDISLYMCKYKAIYGEFWLSAFLKLVSVLRKNEIHCVFIFDGKAPEAKRDERNKRREAKEAIEKKAYLLEQALDVYHQTGVIEKIIQDLHKKRRSPSRRLLKRDNDKVDMQWVEDKIKRIKNQIINVSSEDFDTAKKLFKLLNVPFYTAPWEAEKMCSKLCIDGLVDAVLSEDTDVMAYGTPCFLSKIDTRSETCTEINYVDLIEELDIEESQFLDVCIMSGTDYNTNMPKVGTINSYKLIKKHHTIENIELETKHDTSILKYKSVRELFVNFEDYGIDSIPYCGSPDFEELDKFIKEHNLSSKSIDVLKQNFVKELVFED